MIRVAAERYAKGETMAEFAEFMASASRRSGGRCSEASGTDRNAAAELGEQGAGLCLQAGAGDPGGGQTVTQYGGLLGAITEAVDIQAELDCSAEQAHAVQRERAAARLAKTQEPTSNVVYGVDFRKGRA
jgi:hypothetical protein